jgi:ubiquinone/menaquinone biosynthesis C-methylase UbiE
MSSVFLFPDAYFHRVVISGALHEMPRSVRMKVLSEARRVMKLEGRIVVVEQHRPAKPWKVLMFDVMERFNLEYPTYRDLLNCGLAGEVEQSGFRITRKDTICPEFFEILMGEKPTVSDTLE